MSHRELLQWTDEAKAWADARSGMVGDGVETEEDRKKSNASLHTRKDVFVTEVLNMPVTDLVTHTIPAYPGAVHEGMDDE